MQRIAAARGEIIESLTIIASCDLEGVGDCEIIETGGIEEVRIFVWLTSTMLTY
jgi:hypothetical protein